MLRAVRQYTTIDKMSSNTALDIKIKLTVGGVTRVVDLPSGEITSRFDGLLAATKRALNVDALKEVDGIWTYIGKTPRLSPP